MALSKFSLTDNPLIIDDKKLDFGTATWTIEVNPSRVQFQQLADGRNVIRQGNVFQSAVLTVVVPPIELKDSGWLEKIENYLADPNSQSVTFSWNINTDGYSYTSDDCVFDYIQQDGEINNTEYTQTIRLLVNNFSKRLL